MKKHILGMAKSNIDLKGAKGPKLELDLLRLVYTVKELRSAGDQAKGYLLVVTEKIARIARGWIEKYDAEGTVEVIVPNLSLAQLKALQAEKENNVARMVAGIYGNAVGGQSNATLGQKIGEDALKDNIMKRELGVVEIGKSSFPFGLQWDFYGQIEL